MCCYIIEPLSKVFGLSLHKHITIPISAASPSLREEEERKLTLYNRALSFVRIISRVPWILVVWSTKRGIGNFQSVHSTTHII